MNTGRTYTGLIDYETRGAGYQARCPFIIKGQPFDAHPAVQNEQRACGIEDYAVSSISGRTENNQRTRIDVPSRFGQARNDELSCPAIAHGGRCIRRRQHRSTSGFSSYLETCGQANNSQNQQKWPHSWSLTAIMLPLCVKSWWRGDICHVNRWFFTFLLSYLEFSLLQIRHHQIGKTIDCAIRPCC